MNIQNYVKWKLTHQKRKKNRNLFDKDNFIVTSSYYANNITSTETGVSFTIDLSAPATTYPQIALKIGNASDYRGKTITFSSPDIYGTTATKLSIRIGSSEIKRGNEWKKSGDRYYSTITVDDQEYTTEVLTMMLYSYGQTPGSIITYNKIMVNEGSEVLPYEPYEN